MSQTAPPSTTRPPRRSRWALPLAALLAGIAILLAGFAWFTFVNDERVDGTGTASYVLAADSGASDGEWHWVATNGGIGEPIGRNSLIVPGDRLVFVDTEGTQTEATFTLPGEATDDTQQHHYSVAVNGDIYRLEPVENGTLKSHRGIGWILPAAGSAVALCGSVVVFTMPHRRAD